MSSARSTARSVSLVEVASSSISEWIAGAKPDARGEIWLPPLQQMAQQVGVSRSVLRESIKQLEIQGRLETRHGVGVRAIDQLHRPVSAAVHLLLPEETARLRHLVEARGMLEPAHASFAAERGSDEDLRQLEAIHERLVGSRHVEDAVRADRWFHEELARISGNRISQLMFRSLSDLMGDSLSRGYAKFGTDSAIEEHRRILSAVVRREPAEAARAMILHLSTTLRELELPPTSDFVHP